MQDNWRQALHLEPPQGWLNDPNGLCWFHGFYHVYFQYCPTSAEGNGDKLWGHYRSADLLHWQFRGIVLHPDTPDDRDGVYSGSALVQEDTLHLFYTGNVKEPGDHDYITSGRGANVIHVTTHDGDTMSAKSVLLRNKDYPADCTQHVRDPKVWRENGAFRMVLGARRRDDTGAVLLYRSDDLTHWTLDRVLTSDAPFGYMWECPDLYEIGGVRVLSISPQGLPHEKSRFQNVYQSGYFVLDGDRPTIFTEWDMGFDFYAPQSFVTPDGRRVMFGWMGLPDIDYVNPTVARGWQHCLTLPREVFCDAAGQLRQRPVRELVALRGAALPLTDTALSMPFDVEAHAQGDFTLTLAHGLCLARTGETVTLTFTDDALGGGRTTRTAFVPNCRTVRAIVDRSSVEIYLNGGACVFATRFYPPNDSISLQTTGLTGTIWHMNGLEVTHDVP